MTAIKFPSFYAECAFLDGQRDAREGHSNSRSAYMKWGDPTAGMAWYERGRAAA